ncbi:MAG: DNA polymerase III subunit alpha [Kiritimatiellae bacterium]|nr:DNA polymerase III subunit alpha [Kiritimatiellia bacterium]
MGDFVHLHLHTTYSLLDGQCQIKPLVAKAKGMGMKALAVTDHGNLFALKGFYDACRKAGIKPILGVEAYIVDHDYRERAEYFHAHPGLREKRFHLCLYAKNLTGYRNLVKLMSEAHVNGRYYYPRIDRSLLERHSEGLMCSSACIMGEVQHYLDDDVEDGGHDEKRAREAAMWYKDLFGDGYSLEVMLHRTAKKPHETRNAAGTVIERLTPDAVADMTRLYERQRKVAGKVAALGDELGIRVIATNDVHFLEKDDDDSHDVLLALSTQTKLDDPKRLVYTGEEYFKSEEEMLALFPDHPEYVAATGEVADMVEEYELNADPIMPKFPIPPEFATEEEYEKRFDEASLRAEFKNFDRFKGVDKVRRIKLESDYLAHLVREGAKRRWGENLPKETVERLDFELDVIKQMGFPGYFLIVNDYIAAARRMGVWVGPGRGSAAGAAVAYALGITNVDPLKFDLLFERFLNPDRISMPDIDVDFDVEGRAKVFDFITKKYGQDHVAHIVTFGQMAAKSVIKDVGRAMGYPLSDTNRLVALVPDTPKTTFSSATSKLTKKGELNKDYSPGLVAAFNSPDPVVHSLMERARRLEGGMRQPGVHACGVIISRDPLTETLPVMPTEGESLLTTQYDGHYVEPVGLLKMDFLGLKTLSVEKECVAILGPDNPRVPKEIRGPDGMLDIDRIPDDDEETYRLFGRGETTGLFQFESDGMKKWLRALQPSRLGDLVAMNALYRPGPMQYIPHFVDRKFGREAITYDHPLMETHLRETYGICVYQEQVMRLSRVLAGFSRGDSDKLRKAMGKKQLDVMEALKTKFTEGCLANEKFRIGEWKDEKAARKLIDKIWEDWRAFAEYAFNKSHAVCYAWIAFQTGYLKAHYPAEFMCAQISSEIGNFDKLPGFVAEAQGMGLELKLPDVNESDSSFVPTPDSKGIRYGLGGIKGVGELAAKAIVEERRKNGHYTGFLDFCMRLAGSPAVNKRVLENLARTGAFSAFGDNRAMYFGNIEFATKKMQQRAREKASAQMDFFGAMAGGEEKFSDAELEPLPPFAPAEDLKSERDLMGVYVTGSPLESVSSAVSQVATFTLRELQDQEGLDTRLSDSSFKVDEWKVSRHPNLKDERALKHLDVRLVGIITSCSVKTTRPVGDRPPEKWAILGFDDDTGERDIMFFAKTWKKCSSLEGAVDRLAVVCGEVSRRVDYADDDKVTRKKPSVGDYSFTPREAYPFEEAVVRLCSRLKVSLDYADPALEEKTRRISNLVASYPGGLKVVLSFSYPDGHVVDVEMGEARANPTMEFFSSLGKIVSQKSISIDPSDKTYLDPPRRFPDRA